MAKVALFFVLEKPTLPDNFGIHVSLQAIAPFYESIVRDASITKLIYSDFTAYNFRFFRKPFQTDILVIVRDFDHLNSAEIEETCRKDARSVLELGPNKNFDLIAFTQRALWLPKAVTRQEFNGLAKQFTKTADVDLEKLVAEDTNSGWLMSHPDGFLMGSKNEGDFLRVMAFNAMAMAYQFRLEEGLSRLSIGASAGSQLPRLCEDLSRFQCQYCFYSPFSNSASRNAAIDTHEYSIIAKHLNLPSLLTELDHKVTQALNLLTSRSISKDPELSAVGHGRSTLPEADSDSSSNTLNRILLTLVIIAVACAAVYFIGTDQGQEQFNALISHSSITSLYSTDQ